MIQNMQKNPDRYQNLTTFVLRDARPLHKISADEQWLASQNITFVVASLRRR